MAASNLHENHRARMQARVDRVTADAVSKHDADQARFDKSESKNFNERMMRLLVHRLKNRAE